MVGSSPLITVVFLVSSLRTPISTDKLLKRRLCSTAPFIVIVVFPTHQRQAFVQDLFSMESFHVLLDKRGEEGEAPKFLLLI